MIKALVLNLRTSLSLTRSSVVDDLLKAKERDLTLLYTGELLGLSHAIRDLSTLIEEIEEEEKK